ncbi:MAG: transcription termination factor Rho, partial [Clostridia bacterium]|nr:transcription termination factor Rho [Clostridia bacterium]
MVPENLLEKNLGELRALAQAKGVKNIGKYRKSELIEMLSGQSEPPAPKKRGRPTKAAKAVPLKAETPAEGEPQPASAPAAKAPSQKAKKAPARGKKPQPKGKTAPGAEQPPAQEPPKAEPAPLPEAPKAEEPASQEPAKAENREGTAEKGEPRRRNDRPQNTRYQKGYTRHFGNYNNGERRYQGQNGQEQKTYRPAASAEHSAAAGEEEKPYYNQEYGTANPAVPRMLETENCPPTEGVLEVLPDGYGFLRMDNYYSGPKDIYLSITQIRRFSLKTGDYVEGRARPHREGDKFDALMYIDRVNGLVPDENARRKSFEELVPIFPDERYTLETEGEGNSLSARLIDLIAPIGKGQRAMIVSQPKAGKTTLLKQIAAGISANYPDTHLMVLLIDERPEEVTEMKRCIQGEVIYSTFDELPEHHTRIAEMVQERAMRLVEQGRDVVILLDSLTRLTRAYNLVIPPTGRTLSGGMDPGALHKP